jgi:hypothetical protein
LKNKKPLISVPASALSKPFKQNMSTDHPHVNRTNNLIPEEAIKPPKIFGNFHLDEAVIESETIATAGLKYGQCLLTIR